MTHSPTTPLIEGARDYKRIAAAIRFIEAHRADHPRLDDIAAAVGLSPYHFQRLFSRWAGVSPKRFLGYLTLAHARRLLRDHTNVLDAALETGLSGPSRLHDLTVTLDAVTPGEMAARGAGLTLRHGVIPTPFGPALAALTARGLCALDFLGDDGDPAPALARLAADWPEATLIEDPAALADLPARLFTTADAAARPLPVLVKGTNFQVKVWEALLRVPAGAAVSYGDLAAAAGRPTAHRAVGSVLGANRIGYVIPCHRVLRATGAFSGYRWGRERRMAMLGWEAARTGDVDTA